MKGYLVTTANMNWIAGKIRSMFKRVTAVAVWTNSNCGFKDRISYRVRHGSDTLDTACEYTVSGGGEFLL